MNQLNQHIEALIFCSEQSITLDEIAASLKISYDWEPSRDELLAAIEVIRTKYQAEEFPFELAEISEGYQFLSKKEYHATIAALIQHKARKKLSVSQMETLSIIAYKQPITKSEIEHIRGVNCDYAIHKLLEKEMVEISGKSDGPGRPVLYTTTKLFMDYFGIKSPKDLPQLKDLHIEQNEIGPGTENEGLIPDAGSELQHPENPESVLVSETEAEQEQTILSEDENLTADNREQVEPISMEEEGSVTAESEEIASDDNEDMPPFTGEEHDLELPDRKSIFLESQVNSLTGEFSTEDAETGEETDPS